MLTKTIFIFIITIQLVAQDVIVRTIITKTGIEVRAAERVYKKAFSFTSLMNLGKVQLFYIDSPEKTFGSKSFGKLTASIFGSSDQKLVHHVQMSLEEQHDDDIDSSQDKEKITYLTTIPILNFDSKSKENFVIQSIFISEEEIVIFVGEMKYVSILRYKQSISGYHQVDLGKESFLVTKTKMRKIIQLFDQAPVISFNSKFVPFRNPVIVNDLSGFILIDIDPELIKSFRIIMQSPLHIEIYEANPIFVLDYQYSKNILNMKVISQDIDIKTVNCKTINKLAQLKLSKGGKICPENKTPFNVEIYDRLLESQLTLRFTEEAMKNLVCEKEQDLHRHGEMFDYSIMLNNNAENLKLQLNNEFDNQKVFFKFSQKDKKIYLTLLTQTKNGEKVSKVFNFKNPSAFERMEFKYAQLTKDVPVLRNLKMARGVRLDNTLFENEDFCNILTFEQMIEENFIKISKSGNPIEDIGVFKGISDPSGNLKYWGTYLYVEESTQTLTVMFYNKKDAAVIRILEEKLEIFYANRLQYESPVEVEKYEQNFKMLSKFNVKDITAPFKKLAVSSPLGGKTNTEYFSVLEDGSIVYILNIKDPLISGLLNQNLQIHIVKVDFFSLHLMFSSITTSFVITQKNKSLFLKYKQQPEYEIKLFENEENVKKLVLTQFSSKKECKVVIPFSLACNQDENETYKFLLTTDLQDLDIKNTQKMYFDEESPFLMVSLKNYNVNTFSNRELQLVHFSEEDQTCELQLEKSFDLKILKNEITMINYKKTLSYKIQVDNIPNFQKYKTYNFLEQPIDELVPLSTGKARGFQLANIYGYTGYVVDLNERITNTLFVDTTNLFNQVMFNLEPQGDLINLSYVQEEGELEIIVSNNDIVIHGPHGFKYQAPINQKQFNLMESEKTYNKIILRVLIHDLDDVHSDIDYEFGNGIAINHIKDSNSVFKFTIAANVNEQFLTKLLALLNDHKYTFSANFFEDRRGHLTLLIHENELFETNYIVGGSIKAYFDINSDVPQNNPDVDFINEPENNKQDVLIRNLSPNPVLHNWMFAGEEHIEVAIFELEIPSTYLLVTFKDELNKFEGSILQKIITEKMIFIEKEGFPITGIQAERRRRNLI